MTRVHGPRPVLGRLLLLAQAIAALAFVAALLHAEGVHLGGDAYRVRVALGDAGGLPAGRAQVLVSGVPAGRVEAVRAEGDHAVATLRLDDGVEGTLHDDATAVVEPRSALQDQTVDLRPGSPSAPTLRDGATIALRATSSPVAPDRVLAVLDADTRAQVAVVLDQLAVASRTAPGAMRDALLALRPAVSGTTRVTEALDRRRTQLARLVTSLDRLSAATADRDGAIARTLTAGRATLDVTARRDREIAAGVRRLPATLDAVDGALARLRTLAQPLDPALARLRLVARRAPALLRALDAALPATSGLLGDVDALARRGAAPVASLRSILEQLAPASSGLEDPVAKLEPIVTAVDAKKQGIGTLGENFSGVLSTNDGNGAILRGLGFFEDVDPANFGFPSRPTTAQRATMTAQVASALTKVCETQNPLACLVRYLVPGLPGSVRR